MMEINYRILFNYSQNGLFQNFNRQIEILKQEKGLDIMINREDCTQVHQYCSAIPFYGWEVSMLRRLHTGISICAIQRAPVDYVSSLPLPKPVCRWLLQYLNRFLDRMDAVAVDDPSISKSLWDSGVRHPKIYILSDRTDDDIRTAWDRIYEDFTDRFLKAERKDGIRKLNRTAAAT